MFNESGELFSSSGLVELFVLHQLTLLIMLMKASTVAAADAVNLFSFSAICRYDDLGTKYKKALSFY